MNVVFLRRSWNTPWNDSKKDNNQRVKMRIKIGLANLMLVWWRWPEALMLVLGTVFGWVQAQICRGVVPSMPHYRKCSMWVPTHNCLPLTTRWERWYHAVDLCYCRRNVGGIQNGRPTYQDYLYVRSICYMALPLPPAGINKKVPDKCGPASSPTWIGNPATAKREISNPSKHHYQRQIHLHSKTPAIAAATASSMLSLVPLPFSASGPSGHLRT